jgi:diguanylate cyclase (GGDEF)-like protein
VRLAATDSLTGLPNRRYFLETANLEVARVNRFGAAASVVMIDLGCGLIKPEP